MENIRIINAEAEHFAAILRINEESVHFLSPLTREKLKHLYKESKKTLVAVKDSSVLGFCLVFEKGADYDSVNYRWFENHYDKFLYVDRLVIDLPARGRGLGKLFYDEIFKYARDNNIPAVVAEIDIAPPNPISLEFHKGFGFSEVGKQEVGDEKKVVSLQMAPT